MLPPAIMTSRIEAGITVEGSIRGEGELEVAGRVRGALTLDGVLIVESGGIVEADVEATRIEVSGLLAGSATAHESVQVLAGGRVEARVRSPRMLVDEGAIFRGELQATDDEGAEAVVPVLPARAGRSAPPKGRAPRTPKAATAPTTRGKLPTFAVPDRPGTRSAARVSKPPVTASAKSAPDKHAPDKYASEKSAAEKPARKREVPKMPALPKGRTSVQRRGGES